MYSVCLLTAYDSQYEGLASISAPLMRRWARACDYSFSAVQRDDCGRKGGWIKIEPIMEALSGDSDFVLWLDADAMPVRIDSDIRTIIDPNFDLHIVWHKPISSQDPPHDNTGVMLIRASDWSRRFFERVWEIGPMPHKWNDQAAILHALGFDDVLGFGCDRPEEPDRGHVDKMNNGHLEQ